jgi:hypothetical protein
MRVNTGFSAKAAYYDRNPLDVSQHFGVSGLAPATLTTRATYTVPSGRKAFLAWVDLTIMRDAAAAPAGRVMIDADGPAAIGILCLQLQNVVGVITSKTLYQGALSLAGSVHTLDTWDVSTGGTNEVELYRQITEFDA